MSFIESFNVSYRKFEADIIGVPLEEVEKAEQIDFRDVLQKVRVISMCYNLNA